MPLSLNPIIPADVRSILAAAFNTLSPDELITLPAFNGQGALYRKEIDTGLSMIYWDLTLSKKISIQKKGASSGQRSENFSLIYILLAGDMNVESDIVKRAISLKYGRTILFVPDNAAFTFQIPAGNHIKILHLSIDTGWLRKELYTGKGRNEAVLTTLFNKTNPFVMVETSSPAEMKLLTEIADRIERNDGSLLFIKANVLSLVADFFSKLFLKSLPGAAPQKILYYEQITKLEAILKDHLEKRLPDLPGLAKQIALGTSTLKRHFKIIFGKNVYQYYLELKMDHAMHLLKNESLSVNEVAQRLHYEKVSGFIEMFKKHHGVSPGSLKKSQSFPDPDRGAVRTEPAA